MKISGFLPESYQDWDTGLASVVFTPGCNYACPSCHSKQLLDKIGTYDDKEILHKLDRRRKYISRLVICGGEPTLQLDLEDFCKRAKDLGLAVKLDTNGSNPAVLQSLLKEKLVDYIAMDIKGPRNLYPILTGVDSLDIKAVETSAEILSRKEPIAYEFRTTLVPLYEGENLRWMNSQEAREMSEWVYKITGKKDSLWYIQLFVARGEEMLDKRFSAEVLPKEYSKTHKKTLEEFRESIKRYFLNCRIRGE